MHVYKYTHGYTYVPKYAPLLPTLLAHGIAILGKKKKSNYILMRKCPQSIQTQPTPCHPFTAIVGAEGHNWYIFGYFRSLLAPRATWMAIPGEKIVPTFRPAHTLTYLTLCQPVPSNKNYFDCVYGHRAHFVKRSKSIPEIKAFVLPKYSSDVVLSIIKFTFCFLSCINQFPSLLLNPLSWLWASFF